MREVAAELASWSEEGRPFAIGTVVAVRRSAPRPPGAKMGVAADGAIIGSVSGGCVEGAVAEQAVDVLAGGEARVLSYGISSEDGWDVGLPCGGEIDVLLERFDDPLQARFLAAATDGDRAVLATVVGPSDMAGQRLLLLADGEQQQSSIADDRMRTALEELAAEALWESRPRLHELNGVQVFVDTVAPPPTLMIFGAGEFAQALVRLASQLDWRIVVCDPRTRFATADRFPGAQVIAGWPEQAVRQAGGIDRATYAVVLTHDPKLDDAALLLALGSEAAYVGAMGSRRATEKRRERLLEQGVDTDALARLAAPIGLDLGGSEPVEAALSILGEIVALRYGRAGGRLSTSTVSIHAVAD